MHKETALNTSKALGCNDAKASIVFGCGAEGAVFIGS
jgi:hypothetical protein